MTMTQIDLHRQGKSATLTDAEVSGSAAINITKLNKTVIAADGTNAFSAAQSFGGFEATNAATPTTGTSLATKAYVDGLANGADWKNSVVAATTVPGTFATSFANGQVVDGYTLQTGDRILLKNQSSGAENGIYVVAASGAPTRSADANASSQVTTGMAVFVKNGGQADTGWVLNTTGAIILGTTSLSFTQFTGLGEVSAGNGLSKSGNTLTAVGDTTTISVGAGGISIAAGYTGQTSITTLGTIGTGTWAGTAVALLHGGTGATTQAGAANNILPDQSSASGKYLTSDGANASWGTVAAAVQFTAVTVTGSINGSNTSFTLGSTPNPSGSEQIFQNGLLCAPGGGADYTISGATVTFVTAPATGDVLRAYCSH